uniref:THIOREDOXIN n=1 Tax=Schistosoma mansoni TaxID=6183 RepID=UPI0001DD216C|nr:Chain A, THIOREDOXIN [Schistosoma mansoni]
GSMSKLIELKQDGDLESLLEQHKNKLVVVDFFATWCGPCKTIAPLFKELSEKYDAIFVKVDVDKLEETARKYNISAMPTFIAIKNGEKVGDVVGASIAKVEDMIKKFI